MRDFKNPKPMSDEEIRSFIGRKINHAMNDEDGDLSSTREKALKRYQGDLYGNERDGYSKFRTREVMETIEWVMPSLLRVFTSGDQVVCFEPVGPDDEAAAEQETDIVNYQLLRANGGDGFMAMYSWFKDTLMYPAGYIKAYVEECERVETEHYEGVDPVQLQMLMDDPDLTITGQDTRQIFVEQPSPEGMVAVPVEVFDIEAKRVIKENRLKIECLPPEQVLVDDDCRSPNLDGNADFICHRVEKTYTQLVNEGFDRKQLDEVGTAEDYTWNDETTSRLFYEDETPDNADIDDPSMRKLWVHECYCYLDVDGDGLGEYRKITMVGGEILENIECNYQPIVAASAIPMTHKHAGMSYTQIVEDLQELKTTLTRQLLDNIYRMNVRRKFISEDAMIPDGSTMEAMLNVQAEWIPVRGQPQMTILPESQQSIVTDIMPVIAAVDESRQIRTGVSPNMALNSEVMQQTTASAFMAGMEKASERIEMLVRILAETGFKTLMRKVHQLSRSYPDISKAVKLRGQWIPVDPSGWRERTSMSVNVGLGFNDKSKTIGMAVQLLTIQKEAMQAGLADRDEIYNTLEKLIDSAAFGEPSEYFIKPGSQRDQMLQQQKQEQAAQAPKDPALMIAEAQVQSFQQDSQTKAMKAQADAQLAQMKAQMESMQAQMKAQQEQHQAMMEERELALKEQIQQFEREKWRAEHELERERVMSQKRKDIAVALKALEEAEAANPGENLLNRTAFVFDELDGRLRPARAGEINDAAADITYDDEIDQIVEGDLANARN